MYHSIVQATIRIAGNLGIHHSASSTMTQTNPIFFDVNENPAIVTGLITTILHPACPGVYFFHDVSLSPLDPHQQRSTTNSISNSKVLFVQNADGVRMI